jgi:hypothetical protein
MADDTDGTDQALADLAKYGIGEAGTLGANAAQQAAYQAVIKNLQDRFGDYSKLSAPTANQLNHQLGPTALDTIQNDAQARADEQTAIAQLDQIAKSGGLTLSDRNALNQIEQALSRNAAARNASVANQFAARGQLGSGQQLQMQLANNQNATEQANQRGESIAADAQKRAMQAVLDKGSMARNLANDDYSRKKAAAEAADSINRYNSSMATNATQNSYEDQLRKLQGQGQLTGDLNNAILGSGKSNANTIGGSAYGAAGLVGALGKDIPKGSGGGGGGGSSDTTYNDYPNPDETGGRGGAADLTGGATDTADTAATDATDAAGSSAGDWTSLLDDAAAFA